MPLSDIEIAQAVQIASLLEASAAKPGNVYPNKSFEDLNYNHFLFSSAAVFPAFLDLEEKTVGEIILRGVEETHSYIKTNTNLGILLLTSPLAAAYSNLREKNLLSQKIEKNEEQLIKLLQQETAHILRNLTKKDAELAYQAINYSKAGNLAEVEEGDISEKVELTLYQAMKLAEKRDQIAAEYVNQFNLTFNFAYPVFKKNQNNFSKLEDAVIQTYLEILAEYPDTLIARKWGSDFAAQVSKKSKKLLNKLNNIKKDKIRKAELARFDNYLRSKEEKINPGTTADFIAAVIFLAILISGKEIINTWANWGE
ncbi:MAG: triphosphoribosyl-dephospho-CoA synthase [Halanaerobium sp. MDAL1]|nr:MAG: triphosphoribosyl-dephospho-CoA synthase [Halanaerobium sp. MDAL1]